MIRKDLPSLGAFDLGNTPLSGAAAPGACELSDSSPGPSPIPGECNSI